MRKKQINNERDREREKTNPCLVAYTPVGNFRLLFIYGLVLPM